MAASYKKTVIKTFPKVGEKITEDALYWKHLQFPITKKEHAAVTSIDFSPIAPYPYAVTSSARVQVYSPVTDQVVKSLTRFREVAYCGSFRSDGALLVAGGEEAHIRLYDVGAKSLLRVFRGHQGAIHVTKFTSDNVRIMSGGNDKTVRLFDIPSEKQIIKYSEHQDYVRAGVTSKASPDIFVTGSYDHTVRVFDSRSSNGSVSVMQHGHPVESVLMHPGGSIVVSAGGPVIKVWDILAGGRLLASFSSHHKTVTSMCYASHGQRLVSAGLDRKVKIYDTASYQVVHGMDFPSAVLSVGVSADDSVLAVGMVDGCLSIQHRKEPQQVEAEKLEKKRRKKASYKYQLQGKTYIPNQEDQVIEHKRKEQLAKYDKYFKKFEHSKALDAAMDLRVRRSQPEVTVSVLRELIRRGAIQAALAGRDEKALVIFLKFLQKNISNQKFMTTLTDVAAIIIDVYGEHMSSSSLLDEHLVRLKDTIDHECNYMKELMELMGTMDTIFAASQTVDTNTTDHGENNGLSNVDLKPSAAATLDVS